MTQILQKQQGLKVTKDRDGKAKSDEDFKNASTAEKLEWVKKKFS